MDNKNFQFKIVGVISNTLKLLHGIETKLLSKFSLTHFHTRYLLYLYENGEMTMGELTAKICVDKANTTRAVKDLINKGYIEKVGDNRRKFTLKLSDTGKDIAVYLHNELNKIGKIAFKDFTNEDVDKLYDLSEKFMLGVKNAGIE